MDINKKSTKVLRGMLYALVMIIVLAISLQGYSRDLVHIAEKLRGESSQNVSPR